MSALIRLERNSHYNPQANHSRNWSFTELLPDQSGKSTKLPFFVILRAGPAEPEPCPGRRAMLLSPKIGTHSKRGSEAAHPSLLPAMRK